MVVLIVITCSFCWRRIKCLLSCIPWCCRSPKTMDEHSHFDTTPSSPSSEAVDMEDAMERLEFSSKAPDTQEESHYTNPAKQVQDTMKAISKSAAIRAKAAHELQRNEWDMCGFLKEDQNLFLLKIYIWKLLYIDFILRFSIYIYYILVSHIQLWTCNFAIISVHIYLELSETVHCTYFTNPYLTTNAFIHLSFNCLFFV